MSNWLGIWELIPELSHYSVGGPPERGLYTITQVDDQVHLQIDWAADGVDMNVSFSAPADGTQVPADFPGVDTFSILAEDNVTLSGDAWGGGALLSKAVRRVSNDGVMMSVLQQNADGVGGENQIFQIYKRVSS